MRACSLRFFVLPLLFAAASLSIAGPHVIADQTPSAAEADLILGTWTLNVAQSKYRPGPPPRSQKRTYEPHQDGVKTTIVTVDADGQSSTVQYVAKYDQVQYPLTGSAAIDAIALERIDGYTAEATLTHAGKRVGTARRVISRDGRTMTISFQAANVNNVAVYEKEPKQERTRP